MLSRLSEAVPGELGTSTGMTAVRWAVQDENRAAARSAVSNQPSGLLLSPRFPENQECLPG